MFAVDSKGVVTKINDVGTRWERPVSGRKVRANRRNGRQGKGPTSVVGRMRSSRNALKHGLLARALAPIEVGPFAEDAEAFWEGLSLVIESLDPQTYLEEVLAQQIASGTARRQRLDRFEVAAYHSASRVGAELRRRLEAAEGLDEVAGLARGLHFFLMGASEIEVVPWEEWARLMRFKGPRPGIQIRGLWDNERQPATEDEWRKAFRTLLQNLWEDEEVAARWALAFSIQLSDEWIDVVSREQEVVGDRVLDGLFDKVTRYSSRITNDLVKSIEALRTLREM